VAHCTPAFARPPGPLTDCCGPHCKRRNQSRNPSNRRRAEPFLVSAQTGRQVGASNLSTIKLMTEIFVVGCDGGQTSRCGRSPWNRARAIRRRIGPVPEPAWGGTHIARLVSCSSDRLRCRLWRTCRLLAGCVRRRAGADRDGSGVYNMTRGVGVRGLSASTADNSS
jgi:hypothetical protein